MVAFTFVPGPSPGCVVSSGSSTRWAFAPKALTDTISAVHGRNETVCELSVGPDGDWFLRTQKNNGKYRTLIVYLNSCDVTSVFESWEQADLPLLVNNILSVNFSANGFFMSVLKPGGSVEHVWSGLPESLNKYLAEVESRGIRSVSVGVNDSWVVILNDGTCATVGVVQELKSALAKEPPASVVLALNSPCQYFINYTSGGYHFMLPNEWNSIVTEISEESLASTMQRAMRGFNQQAISNSLAMTRDSQQVAASQTLFDQQIILNYNTVQGQHSAWDALGP